MQNRTGLIVSGAALGAILGGLTGWYLYKQRYEALDQESGERTAIDRGQLVRLGWNAVALLRQITELS